MRYRQILCLLLIFLMFAGTAAAAPKPVIRADKTYYDVNTGLYVLNGNVFIQVRDRIITAGQAKVSLGSLEVWGAGGITLAQGDIYLTADSVHVLGTQNKALLDGGVTFTRTGLAIAAERADFDWKSKVGVFRGNVRITQDDGSWQASAVTYNVATAEVAASF